MSKASDHLGTPINPSPTGPPVPGRPKPDDRHGVGVIAAILTVLALGVAGYWVSGELGGKDQETTKVAGRSDRAATWRLHNKAQKARRDGPRTERAASAIPVSTTPTAATETLPPAPLSNDVYFTLGHTGLSSEAQALLAEQAHVPGRNDGWRVILRGHTDVLGSADFNEKLGRKRAEVVREYLVGLGIPESSIQVLTLGERGGVCSEPTEDCRRRNRRVHVKWVKEDTKAGIPSAIMSAGKGKIGDSAGNHDAPAPNSGGSEEAGAVATADASP